MERIPAVNRTDLSDEVACHLTSGGDERIALDPATGLNKYLCPPRPWPEAVCLSSCTASPISDLSFEAATGVYRQVAASLPSRRREAIAAAANQVRHRLGRAVGTVGLAEIVPCPSGTDAMLVASVLLAAERPDQPPVMVLPTSSETGTGIPRAVEGKPFGASGHGAPAILAGITSVQVALRDPSGEPRPEDEVSRAFVSAVASAPGRAIVVLTHGTKTGLIAPAEPPRGEDVIVDACQARITPEAIRAYLARGWPVVVTGSKFYGSPAFSGAVLVPSARWAQRGQLPPGVGRHAALPGPSGLPGLQHTNLAMVLRWEAALAEIEAFAADASGSGTFILAHAQAIEGRLCDSRHLVVVGGMSRRGPAWADRPTIFTFGVRDPLEPRRLQTATELRVLYAALAREGVLVGQPVDLGAFGGLRVAVGARDARSATFADGLNRLLGLLEWMAEPRRGAALCVA